jgi:hypothetical protein
MLAHLSRDVRKHLVLVVFQLNPEHGIWQSLEDFSHDLYSFFLSHILSEWNFGCADKLRILTWQSMFAKPRHRYQLQVATAPCCSAAAILVNTIGPSSVMAMVCSACALGLPSSVATVQPSANTLVK